MTGPAFGAAAASAPARPGWSAVHRIASLALLALVTLPLAVLQWLLIAIHPPWGRLMPPVWHRIACAILKVRVEIRGTPVRDGPCLYVCNHISWLDIPVLGSRLRTGFIAKEEVAGWGLFGTLAKLQRTVFVARQRRGQTAAQADQIRSRFAEGGRLVLFAEGTSTDGCRVLPFKSALFSVAQQTEPEDRPLPVQPVSLAYTRLNGLPLNRTQRLKIAWIGDMDLVPHFLAFLSIGRVTAVVQFHPPVTLAELGNRKLLAEATHRRVARGVALANAGRLPAA